MKELNGIYVCAVCGDIYDEAKEGIAFENLEDTWVCPECGAPKAMFEKKEEIKKDSSKELNGKYVCIMCGWVYDEAVEGIAFEDLPEDWACPECGAPKTAFEKQ